MKRRIEAATLGPVLHRLKALEHGTQRAILLTEHVTPPLAEELRRRGVDFADAAGNAFIKDHGLFVWVTGRRAERVRQHEARGLHAAGLKLLLVLLQGGRGGATYRALAEEAGIALGGVGWILRELKRREWIRRKGPDELELHNHQAILKAWDEGYAEVLRPKLFLRTCRGKPQAELFDLAHRIGTTEMTRKVLVGGELGAALLTDRMRPTTATLHVGEADTNEVMRRLNLLPDRAGDVVLIQKFGLRNDHGLLHRVGATLADPLLLRAELLVRPDDRLREVAEVLRTEHIETRWR